MYWKVRRDDSVIIHTYTCTCTSNVRHPLQVGNMYVCILLFVFLPVSYLESLHHVSTGNFFSYKVAAF